MADAIFRLLMFREDFEEDIADSVLPDSIASVDSMSEVDRAAADLHEQLENFFDAEIIPEVVERYMAIDSKFDIPPVTATMPQTSTQINSIPDPKLVIKSLKKAKIW